MTEQNDVLKQLGLKLQRQEAEVDSLLLTQNPTILLMPLLVSLIQFLLVVALGGLCFYYGFVADFAIQSDHEYLKQLLSILFVVLLVLIYFAYYDLRKGCSEYAQSMRTLHKIKSIRYRIESLQHTIRESYDGQ
jgi:formate hydrogenlyase subunit 3/multisubunit Na+/H+ antiporter MnhD subunit